MSIVREIKRRNVFRMAVLYIVAAWLIMQVTEVLITLTNLPHWIGPIIIWLLAIGFPISLIFSWFYEITPEGISLEKDVDPEQSITLVTGRRLDFIIISMLVAAVILFAYDKWWIGGPPEKSIAVLAFTNMSDDPEQEYFSDGISEELLNLLSKIPQLTVISRSSAFSFKGKDITIPEVAKQLNVALVLEGSVRRDGDRLRITAQLIEASSDSHLWSQSYDREFDDIFAVQDEISTAIVNALKEHLGLQVEVAVRRRYTENPDAYDAYLQGWALIESFNLGVDGPAKLDAGRQYFDRALALDSAYPLAFVGLAFVESYYAWIGEGTGDNLARAEKYARQALAFDPGLSQAHAVLGDIHGLRDEWAAAIAAYHEAIRLDPQNTYAWEELAWAFNSKDSPEPVEAEQAAREALRLDPTFLWNYYQLGWALEMQGRYEEAVAALEQALRINPAFRSGSRRLGQVYLAQGEYGKALAPFEVARKIQESPTLLRDIAAAHAGLGDTEKALAALADALDSGYRDFSMLDTSSHFAALRDDANFQALLAEYKN